MGAGMFSVIFFLCFHVFHRHSLVFASCPPEFKELCECGYVKYGDDRKLTYVTNCTYSGFDNALMLRKMPPMTEVLIFVGNEVKDLPLNIFGLETVNEKLHTIDFSNNHIQTIKGRTFHNVANVTKLILNNNDLYIVYKDHHPRMFSNFVNLKELHLKNAFTEKVKAGDYLNNLVQIFGNSSLKQLRVLNMESNEISGMDPNEFCFLPALEELHLSDNHLKDLSLNFSCLNNLRTVDASHNFITRLTDETIQSLDSRRNLKLNLTSNQFKCDCNLINTYEWIKITPVNLVNREYYYCYDGYLPNIGQTIMSIAKQNLLCVQPFDSYEHHTSFIVMIIGLLCLSILITILLYKNRSNVGNYLRRVCQPIQSKFNYVSLERSSMQV